MKKKNMKIKDITLLDQISAIELIVDSCFTDGRYTPYYRERASIFAIVEHFIEGVAFDETEDIFECARTDEELNALVKKFLTPHTYGKDEAGNDVVLERNAYYSIMEYVDSNASQMIEFERERLIHHTSDLGKIVEFCEVMIDAFSNFSHFTMNKLTPEQMEEATTLLSKLAKNEITAFPQILRESSKFDMDKATDDILKAKNKQIAQQKRKLTLLQKELDGLK